MYLQEEKKKKQPHKFVPFKMLRMKQILEERSVLAPQNLAKSRKTATYKHLWKQGTWSRAGKYLKNNAGPRTNEYMGLRQAQIISEK